MSGEPLLPDGWVDRFSSRVDLDASFRELEGLHHFYVETMRGRVRSLQLRFDEAWEHFESATDAVDAAEDSIANLVRQFQLEIFRFENALVEEPLDPDVDVPQFDLPDIPEIVFEEYPEVKYVLSLRVNCEALLRLHIGQYEESHRLYERLGSSDHRPERLALCYLGRAACQHNLDASSSSVDALLESAALATAAVDVNLYRLLIGSSLISFHEFLGQEEPAQEWRSFLERLPCPPVTTELFVERTRRSLERSRQHGRLLLV